MRVRILLCRFVPSLVGVPLGLLIMTGISLGQPLPVPRFQVNVVTNVAGDRYLVDSLVEETAPAELEVLVPMDPDGFSIWHCWNASATWGVYYHGVADLHRLEVYSQKGEYNNWGNTCPMTVGAGKVFDLHVSCPDRAGETISVSGIAWIRGGFRSYYNKPLGGEIRASFAPHVLDRYYHDRWSPTSGGESGIFVGMPPADGLEGEFTFSPFSMQLDANGESTREIQVSLEATTTSNNASPNPINMDFVYAEFLGENALGQKRGMGFPVGSPVFVLPEGCSCDAPDVGIIDNMIWTSPQTVSVSGTVWSDCGQSLDGVTVTLDDGTGGITTTLVDGAYAFADVPYSETSGQVAVTVPGSFHVIAPAGGVVPVDLTSDQTGVDFQLECVTVSVSGTVSSDCAGPLENVAVDFLDASGEFVTVSTDADGAYAIENIPWSDTPDAAEISISIPLGFEGVSPGVAGTTLTLDQDHTVPFTLACLQPSGTARSMGYWKHQANVHRTGRGHAHESEPDMAVNFPAAIYDHFHENDLNGIVVEGVTFVDAGSGPEPLDLDAIATTLTVNRGGTMLDRAKQQYLAMLLNIASGKIATHSVVSEDDKTASQALQYLADLINDADPSNDELAKDISETINDAVLLSAGVIPDGYSTIYYAMPQYADVSLKVWPNPGRDGQGYKLSFGMPAQGKAELVIYDVAGRKVTTLLSNAIEPGRRQVNWDGRSSNGGRVGQGVYFARLTTPQGTKAVKFVHLGR